MRIIGNFCSDSEIIGAEFLVTWIIIDIVPQIYWYQIENYI